MRTLLLVSAVGLASVLAIGLLVVQLPGDAVSVVWNGREVEGPLRVLLAGTAGLLGLGMLAAAALLAAFVLSGASVAMAMLFVALGLLLLLAGLPFLAPLAVLAGLAYLALRPRRSGRQPV